MRQINPHQMEIFSRQRKERFIEQLTASAATAYPEMIWMLGFERLRQRIQRYVEEGGSFRLSYEFTGRQF